MLQSHTHKYKYHVSVFSQRTKEIEIDNPWQGADSILK